MKTTNQTVLLNIELSNLQMQIQLLEMRKEQLKTELQFIERTK